MILETKSATHLIQEPLAISVGNFDGVHRGHQLILKKLIEVSQKRHLSPAILTFTHHPLTLIDPSRIPHQLTTLKERANLLCQAGVRVTYLWEFTRELASLTPEQFLKDILRDKLGVQYIVIGHDHTFGKDRSGDWHLVERLAPTLGLQVDYVDALMDDGHPISSSHLRRTLLNGEIEKANSMLGYRFSLSATIESGRKKGKELGFPTINLAQVKKIIPKAGVYAGWAYFGQEVCPAAINISFAQVFHGIDLTQDKGSYNQVVEAYLLDFNGDLYGRQIRLEFFAKIRDENIFRSQDDLVKQIKQDVALVRKALSGSSGR